ncbi:hypothetical protein [Notoacmeibacter sp. MSK16QG-6]|nr:hypothetical protein [Notoacmeibacter sp. MSK16QG-6]MCP1198533.1 hypothetical protein [Notoacmeibacter sp. MSK16QG-6]
MNAVKAALFSVFTLTAAGIWYVGMNATEAEASNSHTIGYGVVAAID